MKVRKRGHLPPQKGKFLDCPHCHSTLVVKHFDQFEDVNGLWATTCPKDEGCGHLFYIDDDYRTYKYPHQHSVTQFICERPGCRKRLDPLITGQHIVVSPNGKQMEVCSDCRDLLSLAGWQLEASAKGIVSGAEEPDGSDVPVTDFDSTTPS